MPFAARSVPIIASSRKISPSSSGSSSNTETGSTYLYVIMGLMVVFLFYVYNKSQTQNKRMYAFKNIKGRKTQNNYTLKYRKI